MTDEQKDFEEQELEDSEKEPKSGREEDTDRPEGFKEEEKEEEEG